MRSLLLIFLLSVPVTALAQPTKVGDVQKMATDDCARARKAGKTCVLSIEGEDVKGTVPTVGDTSFSIAGFGTAESLIRIRRNFIPEILKTAEDID